MAVAELLTRPTAAERLSVMPGDDLVGPADVVMDRALTLPAPPGDVWPWIVQLSPIDAARSRMHLRLRLAPVRHRFVVAHCGGLFDQLTVMALAAGMRERVRGGGTGGRPGWA